MRHALLAHGFRLVPPAAAGSLLAPGRPRGPGCGGEPKIDFTSVSEPPTVR